MKHLFFLFLLVLGGTTLLNAQDYYLPISSKSETAKATYARALALSENADIQAYVKEMRKAVQEDSTLFAGYAHLSLMHVAFKQYAEAKVFITKALAIAPGGFTPAEQILRKLMVQWQLDPKTDPTKIMDELIAAYPNTWQAYDLASSCAMWIKGDDQAALPHLQNMVRLRPDHGSAYNALGYYYMKVGQMDKAKEAFENYIRVAPKEANAYDSMGEYYMTIKDYAKSAEFYDKAAAMGMTDSKARADKARSMIKK